MKFKDLAIMDDKKGVVLFTPHIPKSTASALKKTLSTRWIGQGPMVDKFEKLFKKRFAGKYPCISTGSGTDALHLSYILAGLKKGDEVITPVFTCTATNIPFLYMGVKIKFADIDRNTLNIDPNSVKKLISKKTKAVICVHYGGIPCKMDELNKICKEYKIPLIADSAQSLGAKYNNIPLTEFSDFSAFSFQAIKHITTADGGMLCFKKKFLEKKAKRIRWFGISRDKKQSGTWLNDIHEVGYKYQLNDIGATIGVESLKEFNKILEHRKKIYSIYLRGLKNNKNIQCVHDYTQEGHAAWLFTILTNKKDYLQKKLREKNIESGQVHFRNDQYSIFRKFAKNKVFKNMDFVQNKYLVLPVHTKVKIDDAKYIVKLINKIL